MKKNKFLVCEILLIAFIMPLMIFNGAIDDFVPKLMPGILDISLKGYISVEQENTFPGFFVLGSILTTICGFSVKDIFFFPIQLIPFIFVFFLFLYTFSKNYLLSALLTLIEVISGVSGSLKIFLWPHGLGFILFYISIFTLSKLVSNKGKTSEFRLLFIIIGSSLVFMSYDLFAMFIIFIGAISFIFLVLYIYFRNSNFSRPEYYTYFRNSLNLLLIMFVVELGFSRFFYNNIIPTFMSNNYVEISAIERFISSYFFKHYSEFPLNDLLVNFPMSVSILSAIKYSLLIISILVFMFIMFKKIAAKDTLDFSLIGVFTILVVSAFYALLRLYIGQAFINYIYLPGILSISWLYNYSSTLRRGTIVLVLLILIICPLTYYETSTHNLINKDSNKFGILKEPSDWCFNHENSKNVASDVLTHGIFSYYYTERKIEAKSSSCFNNSELHLFTTNDVLLVLNRSDSSETYSSETYTNFIVNYDLNIINLNNWVVIKSWDFSEDVIKNNPRLNKIYDLDNISIFSKGT